jgi:hypothetical protein
MWLHEETRECSSLVMRFRPGPGQVDPNSLLRGRYSSLAPSTENSEDKPEEGSRYNEQEDSAVVSFGLAIGGIGGRELAMVSSKGDWLIGPAREIFSHCHGTRCVHFTH